jgi:hypothetical protein
MDSDGGLGCAAIFAEFAYSTNETYFLGFILDGRAFTFARVDSAD